MIPVPLDVLDPPRSRLRALATSLDGHVAELIVGDPTREAAANVQRAWLALSTALALGAEPVLRSCPHCSRRIPREAARCRYCMARSDAHAVAARDAEVER